MLTMKETQPSPPTSALLADLSTQDPLGVDQCLNRIQHHKGVHGVLVVNAEGNVVRSNMDNVQSVQHASLCGQLARLAREAVRDLDPENDLTLLRVRTKKHEIMISPAKNFIIIVLQNPDE